MSNIVPFPTTDFTAAIAEILNIENNVGFLDFGDWTYTPIFPEVTESLPELQKCLEPHNLTIKFVAYITQHPSYEVYSNTAADDCLIIPVYGLNRVLNQYGVVPGAVTVEGRDNVYNKEDCIFDSGVSNDVAVLTKKSQVMSLTGEAEDGKDLSHIIVLFNEDVSSYFNE